MLTPLALWRLLGVAAALSAEDTTVVQLRAARAAVVLAYVADTEDEAAIALAIAREESRWDRTAVDPTGACGSGQIQQPALWKTTCKRLAASELESYRVLLRVLRYTARACPSTWQRALEGYVSGKCGLAVDVARARCERVGLCDLVAKFGGGSGA